MKKISLILYTLICSFLLITMPVDSGAKTQTPDSAHTLILGQHSIMRNSTLLSGKMGITYHVVNPTILSVDAAGVITPLQPGSTDILTFAKDKILRGTYRVVGLTPTNPVLEIGKSVTLKLSTDSEELSGMKGIWESSNPYIAQVSSSGKVKAKSVGNATITCSLPNHIVLTAEICVTDAKVTSSKDIYIAKGGVKTIKVSDLKNANASSLNWSTSQENIATVNSKGSVTGKKAGDATIICSCGTKRYSYTVHVISMNSTILMGASDSCELKLENASSNVTWESASPMIAAVSGSNSIATVSSGEETGSTVITATYQGVRVSCRVVVGRLSEQILFMEKGDSTQTSADGIPYLKNLTWNTTDSSVATVNQKGKITAKHSGSAIIYLSTTNQTQQPSKTLSIAVNVIEDSYTGNKCDFSYLMADGTERTYHLYKQNSHAYDSYNRYIAWHGCATCSTTTILNGYTKEYKDSEPCDIINGIEKSVAGSEAWNHNYKEKKLKSQMPPSLYGITCMLTAAGVDNTYVRSYNEKEGKEDIIAHLKTGNPVVFEVRQKSNITGKRSKRWTNSYHTMIMLGVLTNGKILLCDSVDRSWYKNGGQRLKVVEIEDVMEYMFSCTDSKNTMYYTSGSSDGGYIKISAAK